MEEEVFIQLADRELGIVYSYHLPQEQAKSIYSGKIGEEIKTVQEVFLIDDDHVIVKHFHGGGIATFDKKALYKILETQLIHP